MKALLRPWRAWLLAGLTGLLAGLTGGCASAPADNRAPPDDESVVGYYWQSISGHLAMLNASRPVAEWLADARTPDELRSRLELSQRLRDFGVAELGLPDNDSYRRYADIHRSAVVWNVVAAPELSLTLQTWCFPVLGCVGYRGYFAQAGADALGARLKAQGLEVSVYGVPAYSTLGKLPGSWFADPLLSTFINYSDAELARLVFHELAHQVVYAEGDTMFNESFATAVERIGAERWLARHGSAADRAAYEAVQRRRADFQALTQDYRRRLEALYASTLDAPAKRQRKAELMAALRADHHRLKSERWGGFAGYDHWFARANNAALGVLAAYNARVAAFEALYVREGSDFKRFYAEVARLAKLPAAERTAALDAIEPPKNRTATPG
ncbi:MAG: aminopeptidase [Burkholderiales bacterium]|nr:aminopeptidase [Burkholderiales bacterium]